MTENDDVVGNPMLTDWCDQLRRAGSPPRVVLAEGDDPRVRWAAAQLVGLGIEPILISQAQGPATRSIGPGGIGPQVRVLSTFELVNGPAGHLVYDVARKRGWSGEGLSRLSHPVYLAAACVELEIADACVAGSTYPTSDVLRAGIQVIGLKAGSQVLSSSFLMLMPDGSTAAFGDCAVIPDPSEEQLAEIAIATARTFHGLTGREPAVAMLSFSTLGSAQHETVERVRRATARVHELEPGLQVDGEMQFDTAIVSAVASQKAAESSVAGHANVFIFPNLSAGNIGYKIAQRLGGAEAFGPIIQGLRAPMNDLSRGCSVSDIVNVAVISAVQARSSAHERESRTA